MASVSFPSSALFLWPLLPPGFQSLSYKDDYNFRLPLAADSILHEYGLGHCHLGILFFHLLI